MFYYDDLNCPVCGKRFSADDDIVVCPKCGLPHHRECWARVGHCFEAKKHDTAEQWTREKAVTSAESVSQTETDHTTAHTQVCSRCGMCNPEYAEFCNRCGQSLKTRDWHSAESQQPIPPVREFSPYSQGQPAYSSAEMIGDYTAQELAAFVGKNAAYYIIRFRNIVRGGSGGWNWPAFLLGPFWLFYRKQYGLGFMYFIVHMLSNIAFAVAYAPVQWAETEAAAAAAEAALMESPLFIPVALLSFVFLIMKVLLGIKGNDFYLRFCEKKIALAKEQTPDLSPAELSSIGGVAVGVAVLFYVLSSFAVELITFLTM